MDIDGMSTEEFLKVVAEEYETIKEDRSKTLSPYTAIALSAQKYYEMERKYRIETDFDDQRFVG